MKGKKIQLYGLTALVLLAASTFGGIVFGFGGDVSGDFVCSNTGTFTDLLSTFIALFMFGTPVAGVLLWFIDKSTESIERDDNGAISSLVNNGDKAIKLGVLAPVGLYAFQFVLSVALDIDISCLTP